MRRACIHRKAGIALPIEQCQGPIDVGLVVVEVRRDPQADAAQRNVDVAGAKPTVNLPILRAARGSRARASSAPEAAIVSPSSAEP
jgi:hypothetical protein